MKQETDFAIYLLIMMFVASYEAILTIYQAIKNGVLISQKELLLKKTNADLRRVLIELHIKPKRMNKLQMVEAILTA